MSEDQPIFVSRKYVSKEELKKLYPESNEQCKTALQDEFDRMSHLNPDHPTSLKSTSYPNG